MSVTFYFFFSQLVAHSRAFSSAGRIPIDPQLGLAVGEGQNYLEAFEGSGTYSAVMGIASALLRPEQQEPPVAEAAAQG